LVDYGIELASELTPVATERAPMDGPLMSAPNDADAIDYFFRLRTREH
jgi:hypothetical protein